MSLRSFLRQMENMQEVMHLEERASSRFEISSIIKAFDQKGAHPSLKHATVVDTDIGVFNPVEVEWAIATRFQASEDLIVIPNA